VYPLKSEKNEPHRWLKISFNDGVPTPLGDVKTASRLVKEPPKGLDQLLRAIHNFVYGSAMARMWLDCLVSKPGAPRMRPRPFIVKALDEIVSQTDWSLEKRTAEINKLNAQWLEKPLPPPRFMK
jgi:hypothetical protein